MSSKLKRGFYFVFEGPDGSGKSTQSHILYEYLSGQYGNNVIHTRHPGATDLGKEIRHIIKHRDDIEVDMLTERLLMACDNSVFINTILKPSLEKNMIVIADRSNFISDYAYGVPGQINPDDIHRLLETVRCITNAPKADACFIHQCKWETAKSRMFGDIEDGKQLKCRIESRGDQYFKNVAEVYNCIISKQKTNMGIQFSPYDYVEKFAERFIPINTEQTIDEVAYEIRTFVDSLFLPFNHDIEEVMDDL